MTTEYFDVFTEDPDPQDIKQGLYNDHGLISAISALAERP